MKNQTEICKDGHQDKIVHLKNGKVATTIVESNVVDFNLKVNLDQTYLRDLWLFY